MTDHAPTLTTYAPTGHPVRWFVMALGLATLLLGGVWWSGVGRPRVSVEVTEARPDGATLLLTNAGRAPIELNGLSFDDPRLEGESASVPGVDLGADESVEVLVRYTATCTPAPPGGYYVPIEIDARTAIGLDRTVSAGSIALVGDSVCGDEAAP